MTIDEAIAKLRSDAAIDKYNMCGYSMEQHKQISEWLEELKELRATTCGYNKEDIELNRSAMYNKMKLTNEICISFLRGTGWLYNHDKEITIGERNKAIDDLMEKASECFIPNTDWDYLVYAAEQLKEGKKGFS